RARTTDSSSISLQLEHFARGRWPDRVDRDVTHVHGWRGPAYREFESRQHVARSRDDARERNRAPDRARRVALADRTPIVVRRLAPCLCRRRRRACRQRLVQQSPRAFARTIAWLDEFFLRSRS